MKIEKVKISELNSPDWNPRYITEEDFNKLKNSIETFGYVDPIIVNKYNMNIVGGNQRYQALVKLGYEDVDVIFIDEPNLDREKALNIALNKISGDWDTVKLNSLVEELKMKNFDLDLTGFDEIELEEIALENESIDIDGIEDDFDEDEFLFEDDYDLNYTIKFNSKKDEQSFYVFLDKVNNEYDGNVSTNILDFLEKYIEENPNKYNSEYELILQDDNEKDRLYNLLYKLEERNGINCNLFDLIREV